jgi:hypothetical protein
MSVCESSYPSELPLGCLQQLLVIVRGGKIEENIQEFSAAAWSVVGYCLKVLVGEPTPVVNGRPPALKVTSEACVQLVELHELLKVRVAADPDHPMLNLLHTFVVPLLAAAIKKLLDSLGE